MRTSKYSPELIKKAINLKKGGYSYTSIKKLLGFNTLYDVRYYSNQKYHEEQNKRSREWHSKH